MAAPLRLPYGTTPAPLTHPAYTDVVQLLMKLLAFKTHDSPAQVVTIGLNFSLGKHDAQTYVVSNQVACR